MFGTGRLRVVRVQRNIVTLQAVDCRDGIFAVRIFPRGRRSRTIRFPGCPHNVTFSIDNQTTRIVILDCQEPGGSFDSSWRWSPNQNQPIRIRLSELLQSI
ncbi:hypothetical protein SAMN05444955_10521 [Lihuaxuella thermophila]|uniref:Uncharacterized protein n=1 Tax=Lihuaxuella thermophila TaxID=1173111 RepID=A0A1H8D952_9BACL|nr:hypothetical protein SAMN05444955_10521 [Lihuaxuella thermophila]